MANYVIKRVEGPVPSTVGGTIAWTVYMEDTATGAITPYHLQGAAEDLADPEVVCAMLVAAGFTPGDCDEP